MKEIKVLGTGCTKYIKTVEKISKIAKELNINVLVIKETDLEIIMEYGVMTTPAVLINNVNVHSGSIPDRDAIRSWLIN
ncbi:thioredoxin family protein [Colwellia sp. MB3u-55]|uniref:thioredoxin family protein n=1 Tax=Colwellia sp. MB3u-55 TaxID=2759810 RepID=UPI0015F36604|nr:thioredoxin family protein [Colwellia sp. MB3u-55]MBA6252307.1 thioredoxin family protein [Colwellia sp. MB3u-55]